MNWELIPSHQSSEPGLRCYAKPCPVEEVMVVAVVTMEVVVVMMMVVSVMVISFIRQLQRSLFLNLFEILDGNHLRRRNRLRGSLRTGGLEEVMVMAMVMVMMVVVMSVMELPSPATLSDPFS